MHLTVYLGALEGKDPALGRAVTELGTWIGQSGHTLVYGGSKTGLTEVLVADVLAAGGTVIDIAPQFSTKERQTGVHFVETLEEIQQILAQC